MATSSMANLKPFGYWWSSALGGLFCATCNSSTIGNGPIGVGFCISSSEAIVRNRIYCWRVERMLAIEMMAAKSLNKRNCKLKRAT